MRGTIHLREKHTLGCIQQDKNFISALIPLLIPPDSEFCVFHKRNAILDNFRKNRVRPTVFPVYLVPALKLEPDINTPTAPGPRTRSW